MCACRWQRSADDLAHVAFNACTKLRARRSPVLGYGLTSQWVRSGEDTDGVQVREDLLAAHLQDAHVVMVEAVFGGKVADRPVGARLYLEATSDSERVEQLQVVVAVDDHDPYFNRLAWLIEGEGEGEGV